jgi:deoxyribose-phosphate aldolase
MDLAPYIEHTRLSADTRPCDVDRLVDEARSHGFCGVCVPPRHVRRAVARAGESSLRIVTVVGFPLAGSASVVKAFEAQRASADGAHEIDMVLSIGDALAGDWDAVRADVDAVRAAAPSSTLKVILETGLLSRDQMKTAALSSVDAGAEFVKTSTGYGPRGASVEDVAWLVEVVGGRAQVKASGGIRTRRDAEELVAAGATRIGTSHGLVMVTAAE